MSEKRGSPVRLRPRGWLGPAAMHGEADEWLTGEVEEGLGSGERAMSGSPARSTRAVAAARER